MKKWLGKVTDGVLYIKEVQEFKRYLLSFKGDVEVVVSKPQSKRSIQQNRYLWGVAYKLICEHTGNNKKDIHEFLLNKFAPRKYIEIEGKTEIVTKRSSKMSKIDFMNYKESIQQWAAEVLELYIPDPEECKIP